MAKRFGTRVALEDVDLVVPRGCAHGFLGANGAGKTTLIRPLLGLAEPTAVRMRVLSCDVPAHRAAALARVGAIVGYIGRYHYRPHSRLPYRTPHEVARTWKDHDDQLTPAA